MGKVIAARDGEVRVVLGEGESIHCHSITWSPSGHLIYNRTWHNRGIWAVPFSIDLLVPTGEPFLVAADGDYPSVAGDGTLAYLPVEQEFEYELVWVDRRGVVLGTVGKPAISLGRPSLSPDGTRVAYHAKPDAGLRLEIYARDLTGEVPVRLTFSGGWSYPEWSPDGRLLIFSYGNKIAAKSADGSGELQQLFKGSQPSITPDGLNVIYHYFQEGKELRDVLIRPLDGSDEPVVLVGGAMEEEGRLSPAGDYLAYQSDETGTDEIYLTSYPGGEGKWQLSTQGGRDMRWVGDGNELIYREPGGPFMSVTIRRDPKLHIAEPVVLFEIEGNELVDPAQGFDVSPNGERLLMVRRIPVEGDGSSIVILQNWLANF